MAPDEVKQLIEAAVPGCEATVNSADGSHFDVIVVGEAFRELGPVKRQQLVYGALAAQITGGAIHAINMRTYTAEEWEKARKLQIS